MLHPSCAADGSHHGWTIIGGHASTVSAAGIKAQAVAKMMSTLRIVRAHHALRTQNDGRATRARMRCTGILARLDDVAVVACSVLRQGRLTAEGLAAAVDQTLVWSAAAVNPAMTREGAGIGAVLRKDDTVSFWVFDKYQ